MARRPVACTSTSMYSFDNTLSIDAFTGQCHSAESRTPHGNTTLHTVKSISSARNRLRKDPTIRPHQISLALRPLELARPAMYLQLPLNFFFWKRK